MKNCLACGEPNRDDALFCSACGARFPQQDQGAADPGAAPGPEPRNPNYQAPGPQPGYDGQPNYGGPYHGAGAYPPPVEPRSVAICLILSLVTCGIYMLYWMYKVNDWFPNYGCSRYQLQNGDVVEWEYTCELGKDIGGGYAAGGEA